MKFYFEMPVDWDNKSLNVKNIKDSVSKLIFCYKTVLWDSSVLDNVSHIILNVIGDLEVYKAEPADSILSYQFY